MSNYLFVYGTLRNEYNNEMAKFLRKHADYQEGGLLNGELYDVGSYPAAIFKYTKEAFIHGQIFKMHNREKIFQVLDPYEGIDDELYIRRVCPVKIPIGTVIINEEEVTQYKELLCWVYLYNRPVTFLKHVPSGDYMLYLSKK